MKILVTGAEGFIGRHLCKLLRRSHEVTATDVRQCDVTRRHEVKSFLGRFSPDLVIHLAAMVTRCHCEKTPRKVIEANAYGTLVVAQECARTGTRLLYTSSSEVYGDHGDEWAYEGTTLGLSYNLYGLTKRWGEDLISIYCEPEKTSVARLVMAYGPGMPVGPGFAALPTFIDNALRRKPIEVHAGAERSWCWANDVAAGLEAIAVRGIPGEVYNVGRDDEGCSMLRIAELACDVAGASRDLVTEVPPPSGPARKPILIKRLSCAKLAGLGWLPQTPLEEGMKLMAADLVERIGREAKKCVHAQA